LPLASSNSSSISGLNPPVWRSCGVKRQGQGELSQTNAVLWTLTWPTLWHG
jgi:hypothetical protein